MIEKPTIIVTSLGRTGTKFFHLLFKHITSDSTSLHEPDVLNLVQYQGQERIRQLFGQLREAGVRNLIIRKVLGKWNLINLSDARIKGNLSYATAVQRILCQRKAFIRTRPGALYIEANIGYYGLIDVLKDVFENHRAAYIVRDGRDWVRSHMNWGEMYGKGRVRSLIAHTWPTALEIEGDPYRSKWTSMSRFEKLCWAWASLNRCALGTIPENPNARVFRFEDIFLSESKYQHLADLVQFVTTFPGLEPIFMNSLEGWLERQVHRSSPRFARWTEWPIDQVQKFETICGPLMQELDYV